jgi:hypothetical protein
MGRFLEPRSGLAGFGFDEKATNGGRIAMGGQRYNYLQRSERTLHRAETIGRIWAWLAGAAVAFIGFIVVAAANHSGYTASDNNATTVITRAPNTTIGSGSPSPQPPAPTSNKIGVQ